MGGLDCVVRRACLDGPIFSLYAGEASELYRVVNQTPGKCFES